MAGKKGVESIGFSFSMIFSILLIVFFIVIAFIAIRYFLGLKECAQVNGFVNDLRDEVTKAWNSEKSEFSFDANLPTELKYVCFANLSKNANNLKEVYDDINIYRYEKANMFFYPVGKACDAGYTNIEHLDLNEITKTKNPYCISVENSKISINIEKQRTNPLIILK